MTNKLGHLGMTLVWMLHQHKCVVMLQQVVLKNLGNTILILQIIKYMGNSNQLNHQPQQAFLKVFFSFIECFWLDLV